jgi:two-component system chemotaxis response regulator CheY
VLVVDDNSDHRAIAAALLTHGGYTALQAETTAEATGLLHAYNPDLLIIDIDMPDKNGLAWALELRSNPATSRTPIIIYSSFSDVYRTELRRLNISWIEKSVSPMRFLEGVAKAFADEKK